MKYQIFSLFRSGFRTRKSNFQTKFRVLFCREISKKYCDEVFVRILAGVLAVKQQIISLFRSGFRTLKLFFFKQSFVGFSAVRFQTKDCDEVFRPRSNGGDLAVQKQTFCVNSAANFSNTNCKKMANLPFFAFKREH